MTRPPAPALVAGRVHRFLAGIRGRMIVLLMAAGVPMLVIAVGNALQGRDAALREGRRAVATAREVALAETGAGLDDLERLLRALSRTAPVGTAAAAMRPAGGAVSGTGAADPDAACSGLLRQILDLYPDRYANLWLLGPRDGPSCAAVPAAVAPVALPAESALAGGRALFGAALHPADGLRFGDILRPDPAGPALLPFALPLEPPGASGGSDPPGDAAPPPRWLAGTLRLEGLAPAGPRRAAMPQTWILDGRGTTVPFAGTRADRVPDAAALDALVRTDRVLLARSAGDEPMAYAAAPLGASLWLVVGQPFAAVEAAAWATLLQRLAELAVFLLLCLVVIVVGADLAMVRPLHSLAGRVKAWRPGSAFVRPPSSTEPREVIELEQAFDDAVRALAGREAELHATIEQRDALMAEIHHRVKNNLQIVSSLLNLQAGRIADPTAQAEFRAARNRVRALATLHRHLYLQHSFEALSLRPFLEELAAQQFSAQGGDATERVALRVEACELLISTDQAVSVALLVTEAVGNAVAHAFPGDRRGTVTVRMTRQGDEVTVGVADDGIGLPEAAPAGSLGLGLQLLDGFARQLGGRLQRGAGPGTQWSVRFPLRERAAPHRPAVAVTPPVAMPAGA